MISAVSMRPWPYMRPFRGPGLKPLPVRTARAPVRAAAGAADNRSDKLGDGVLPGIASWPPKPISDSGAPKPEDDPANYVGTDPTNMKRVAGPSDEEVAAKKEEGRKKSPFSTGREGGTQAGGGGEGSAS